MKLETIKDKVVEKTTLAATTLLIAALLFKSRTIDPLTQKFAQWRIKNREVNLFKSMLDSEEFDEWRANSEVKFEG